MPRGLFFSLDLKDAYIHIQIAPHHRPFLRFAFEGVAYQYTVLPFGLSLAPRTFTKCMDAAISPPRQMGIRILKYLDNWLILAQSEVELLTLPHSQPLRGPGTQSQLCQECTVPQPTDIFPGNSFLDSAQMRAAVMPERTLVIQRLVDLLRNGSLSPSEIVSEDAEPRVFCVPSATDETEGSIWHLVWQPLQSVDLESLSLKTALLLALASVKRMCGLQALSVISTYLQFGPNDTKVILKPRHGYIPKVLSTPFSDKELNLLCSVRTLKIYLERYALFRQSEQFFVCFDNRTKGRPVMKQRLSRWIFDAITLGYSSLGLHFPIGVRSHSTRVIASSWAWSSKVSITEICAAADLDLPSTFARFYNL